MENKSDSGIKVISNLALFFLVFGIFVALGTLITLYLQPNLNGLGGIVLSLVCGTPTAILIFIWLRFMKRSKWYFAFALPPLIFLLLISLFLAWQAFEQRPENIFKAFVADLIPVEISNIQARDVTEGFDEQKIIVAFNATPEVIEKLIADNQLVQVQESTSDMDPGFEKFSNIDLNQAWTIYEKNYSKDDYSSEYVTIWVNPERNTVLFQYFVY